MHTTRRLRRPLTALPLVAALALAAPAAAAPVRGTVVHRNHRAHSFVIATARGRLLAIHSSRSPRVGRTVRVRAGRLANGTYSGTALHVLGRRTRVRLRGVVTWVDPRTGAFTLSSRGASLLIHPARTRARAVSPADPAPALDSSVTVDAGIDTQGDLDAQDVSENGDVTGRMHIEGTILSIDPQARTLTVSADDDDESGASVTVSVPGSVDIAGFQVGQEVELTVIRQPDGTLAMTAGCGDDNAQEADGEGDGEHAGDREPGDGLDGGATSATAPSGEGGDS